jgi:hypothetical protein
MKHLWLVIVLAVCIGGFLALRSYLESICRSGGNPMPRFCVWLLSLPWMAAAFVVR